MSVRKRQASHRRNGQGPEQALHKSLQVGKCKSAPGWQLKQYQKGWNLTQKVTVWVGRRVRARSTHTANATYPGNCLSSIHLTAPPGCHPHACTQWHRVQQPNPWIRKHSKSTRTLPMTNANNLQIQATAPHDT